MTDPVMITAIICSTIVSLVILQHMFKGDNKK